MRTLALHQPRKLGFGVGAVNACADDLIADRRASVFIATTSATQALAEPIRAALDRAGARVTTWLGGSLEPTINAFREALAAARNTRPDAVVGLGGGSVLDVAKLV